MVNASNKLLCFILNFFLLIWQCTQVIPGLICLLFFRNGELYTNEKAHITVLKVNKGNFLGGACFSLGPIIFVAPNCSDEIIKHETGHSVQSIYLGILYHFIITIPSVILFWRRRIQKKSDKWYHSHFPENSADKLGGVDINKLF